MNSVSLILNIYYRKILSRGQMSYSWLFISVNTAEIARFHNKSVTFTASLEDSFFRSAEQP